MRWLTGGWLAWLWLAWLAVPVGAAGAPTGERGPQGSPGAGPSATARQWFVDVAASTGVDFVHFNGMSGRLYYPEVVGAGGAFLDYDNDGDLDVYLVQGTLLGSDPKPEEVLFPPRHPFPLTDRLYRNDLGRGGAGLHFTDVTGQSGLQSQGYGMGVATGDYDNDGFVDLYVTNFGRNGLLHNNGDGTFTDVAESAGAQDERWSVGASFVDYDRDGDLDLMVVNYVDYTDATHKSCLSERGEKDYCLPSAYRPQPDRLFRNRGDGTFEDATRTAGLHGTFGNGLGVVSADFNGDRWLDLYVANDLTPNQLWLNQKDGTFVEDALAAGCGVNQDGKAEASMGVAAGDLDGDGDEDLFMTHFRRETNTVYTNDGRGFFVDATLASGLGNPSWPYTAFGTGWFDYDNDGWLDLVTVNGAVTYPPGVDRAKNPYPLDETNQLFHNLGGGRFEEVTAQAGEVFHLSEVSRGVAFGDVDNDGDTDLLISNNNGPARLLVNQVGGEGGWLGLRLVGGAESGGGGEGVASLPRDLLGARVGVLRPQAPTLWRRVATDGSYASASDPRVLVGLGELKTVTGVRVEWPDGEVEEWAEVVTGSYTTLRRGTGTAVP